MIRSNKQERPVALVTGAARRVGAAIVIHLQQAGYRVVLHCNHSLVEAEVLAKTLNQQTTDSAHVLSANLTQKDEALALIQQTISWGKRLDLLVNNAAVFEKTPESPIDDSHWDALFITNVQAPFWLSNAAYPFLKETKGSIVNITDIHANKPLKGYAVYCQSKAALAMQTKALAKEFAPSVRVNAVAPGAVAWPEKDNVLSEDVQQKIMNDTPLKAHGEPHYIAQAVLALVDNVFVTGQILAVDGGRGLT